MTQNSGTIKFQVL